MIIFISYVLGIYLIAYSLYHYYILISAYNRYKNHTIKMGKKLEKAIHYVTYQELIHQAKVIRMFDSHNSFSLMTSILIIIEGDILLLGFSDYTKYLKEMF